LIEVPAWVPDSMVREYRRRIYNYGQFEAAAWARRRKRKLFGAGAVDKLRESFQSGAELSRCPEQTNESERSA
jgi:hypothetical protein